MPDDTALVAPDLLEQRAQAEPQGIAFVVDGSADLRYGDWDARSNAVAHRLLEQGTAKGDRIGLFFGGMDWIDYAIAYSGVLKAGAIAVHLSTELPLEEVERRLAQCGVSRLIHTVDATVPDGLAGWKATVGALDGGDHTRVGVAITPEDLADIFYTSGTTGPAKAYTVPHGNLTFGRKLGALAAFGEAQHMLVSLQVGTGSGGGFLNISTVSTMVAVLCPPRNMDRLGHLIETFQTGMVPITPWVAIQMIRSDLHKRYDLSSVHTFANASAPLPPTVALTLLEMVPGSRISSACSQSEAGPALLVNVFDPKRPLSVGRPSPVTELQVVDDGGSPVPAGEVGEIWLRTPAPKRLYLDRPDLNAPILADGWYRTGDLGQLDSEGWLDFFDRRVDAVPVRGQLVSTVQVEAAIYEHPAVVEAAAFGIPADAPEQQVAAAVVLTSPDALAQVEAHLRERLASAQVPVKLLVLDALPRNSQGKVLKRCLREKAGRG